MNDSLRATLIWRIDLRLLTRARLGARLIWMSMTLMMADIVLILGTDLYVIWNVALPGIHHAMWSALAISLLGLMVGVACIMMPVSVGVRRGVLVHTQRLPRSAALWATVLIVATGLFLLFAVAMVQQRKYDEAAFATSYAALMAALSTLPAISRLDLFAHIFRHQTLSRMTSPIMLWAMMSLTFVPLLSCAVGCGWPIFLGWFIWMGMTLGACVVYDRRLSGVIGERRESQRDVTS